MYSHLYSSRVLHVPHVVLRTFESILRVRGGAGSEVDFYTNTTRPDDLTTLIICTLPSPKHPESLSGSKVVPNTRTHKVQLIAISGAHAANA